jgi:hypothetical protein
LRVYRNYLPLYRLSLERNSLLTSSTLPLASFCFFPCVNNTDIDFLLLFVVLAVQTKTIKQTFASSVY